MLKIIMKSFSLLLLIASLHSTFIRNGKANTSILKKTKDTVNKIEIRNQEQCDKEAEVYSQTSVMRREICNYEN
tara:strand:+ start:144 stop:365 length:222 start_codon:yes stop_codon:yes gene_type:complete